MVSSLQALEAASDLATVLTFLRAAYHVTRWRSRARRHRQASNLQPTRLDGWGRNMIEILGRSGEPEAMNCPALICDACRKQITDSGNIVWGGTVGVEPRLSTPLFVAHKGHCDQVVSKALEAEYPGDEWVWLWEEASDFLKYLAGNFKRPFSKDKDGTYHEQKIALPKGSARR